MLRLFNVLILALLFLCYFRTYAQNYPVYNSYYVNPYLYNPAEVATEYAYIYFNHRQQWMGIEGAPTVSTLSYSSLINESYSGYGGKISNYKRGILETTDIQLTLSRGFILNDDNVIFFGMSAGAISSTIDMDQLTADDLADPAIASYLANNFQPAASFGMVFKSTSGLNFSVSLPQLFSPTFNAATQFSATEVKPFDNAYICMYYRKKMDGRIVVRRVHGVRRRIKTNGGYAPLELYALYRYVALGTSQFEVMGKLNLSEYFWLGAGYRQSYGLVANTGLNVKRFSMAYSYEPGTQPEEGFSTGTHEIQLGFKLGDKKEFRKPPPPLLSKMTGPQSERHLARFQSTQEDPGNIDNPENVGKKKYYVVIKGYPDFSRADALKRKLLKDKYNADIFYHQGNRRFYVFVYSTVKSSEAYKEARNLKHHTELKTATVIIVDGDL